MFSYVPLVLRNAVGNRRRTTLTVASVADRLGRSVCSWRFTGACSMAAILTESEKQAFLSQ